MTIPLWLQWDLTCSQMTTTLSPCKYYQRKTNRPSNSSADWLWGSHQLPLKHNGGGEKKRKKWDVSRFKTTSELVVISVAASVCEHNVKCFTGFYCLTLWRRWHLKYHRFLNVCFFFICVVLWFVFCMIILILYQLEISLKHRHISYTVHSQKWECDLAEFKVKKTSPFPDNK